MTALVPIKANDIVVEQFDDEVIVYRPKTRTVINLNETATAIWRLCDGTRSVEDIIGFLSKEYPESIPDIENDVKMILKVLHRKKAILYTTPI